ncbi:MAG: hypothetical protein PVJ67_04820 [Candidatus Pacearchaeota archaeon]|jgi:hypothetical protein
MKRKEFRIIEKNYLAMFSTLDWGEGFSRDDWLEILILNNKLYNSLDQKYCSAGYSHTRRGKKIAKKRKQLNLEYYMIKSRLDEMKRSSLEKDDFFIEHRHVNRI